MIERFFAWWEKRSWIFVTVASVVEACIQWTEGHGFMAGFGWLVAAAAFPLLEAYCWMLNKARKGSTSFENQKRIIDLNEVSDKGEEGDKEDKGE